jgi:hypothetical protein
MNTIVKVLRRKVHNVASFVWHAAGHAVGYVFLLLKPKASLAAEVLALRNHVRSETAPRSRCLCRRNHTLLGSHELRYSGSARVP